MLRNKVAKWANSTWAWAMRVTSIRSMRPSTNMLGPELLLKPKVLTMGKLKASIFTTNLGLMLQLKPKSNTIMGKPKTSSPSQTWAWCPNLSPNPFLSWASPRLHLLHSLPLRLGIILRGSFHHRQHHGERSSGGSPAASRRSCRHGGWCKCLHSWSK